MKPNTTHTSIALLLAAAAVLRAQAPAPARQPVPGASVTSLPETVVYDNSPTLYGPPPITNITGLPAPIKELPITVSTVSDQFIRDTSAQRVRDLVGYIPGVNASEDSGATGDLLNIRGFDFIYNTFVNGMRNRAVVDASRGFDNIQRVEILKGPAGVEFGLGDPGGFVNYVTKKPLMERSLTLGMEVASYDYIGGYLDATGPLWRPADAGAPSDGKTVRDGKTLADGKAAPMSEVHDDRGLYYRMIVAGDRGDSFRDAHYSDRVLVAPSLLWNYAEESSVLLEIEYSHRDQPYDRGIIYLEGAGFDNNFAPINRSYHEPDDFLDSNNTRTSLYWNHKLDDHFKLRLTAEVNTSNVIGRGVRNPATFLLYVPGTNQWNGNRTVQRTTHFIDRNNASYAIKPEVLVNFETGPLKHTGLFGFSYEITNTDSDVRDGFDSRPIDFKNPVYGLKPIKLAPADPSDPNSIPARARLFALTEDIEEYGVYYQHKIDMWDRLHLLGGVRYDWYRDESAFTRNTRIAPLGAPTGFNDQNLSWRVGAVGDLTKQVSLFAGYTKSYQPQNGLFANGDHPDALEAEAVEAGIKASFLDGRLQTTLSAYQTKRKNILEADPNDPTFTFVIPIGDVKVRGLEFEMTGEITRDLSVQGGFALMDTEITETLDPLTKGNEFYNVPNVQAGLRLRYDTSRWLIPGLSVGAGVVYVGDRAGDTLNSFTLPDYWRFDAGLYYHWRNWNFKLTCENVADERYYLASQNVPDIIQPGAPRLFTFGAEVKF